MKPDPGNVNPKMIRKWPLRVDYRECKTQLYNLALASHHFDIRLETLKTGDYVVNERVLIERKSPADFAVSVIDGRLFHQASALVRAPFRCLILVEGELSPGDIPIHHHSWMGAILSLAVAWGIPVIITSGPEESQLALRLLAEQTESNEEAALTRHGYRPRRLLSRRLFVIQGLPGVGPKLSRDLLRHFGTVENVFLADCNALAEVGGIGPKKARSIRRLIT